jgi:hypothetical protein
MYSLEGHRVHAVAETAGGWAIREHVAQMGVARIADSFDPLQEAWPIEMVGDRVGARRLRKRRPARAGFEFLRRVEQDRIAAAACIDSGLEQAAHLRTEGVFGAGLARDAILLRAQLRAPFGIAFFNPAGRSGIAILGEIQDVGPLNHQTYLSARLPGILPLKSAVNRRANRLQ